MAYDEKEVKRVVKSTAAAISAALDNMARDLPDGAASQMVLERVVRELKDSRAVHFWSMALILFEDALRENRRDSAA